jgi:hypothetical protein
MLEFVILTAIAVVVAIAPTIHFMHKTGYDMRIPVHADRDSGVMATDVPI